MDALGCAVGAAGLQRIASAHLRQLNAAFNDTWLLTPRSGGNCRLAWFSATICGLKARVSVADA